MSTIPGDMAYPADVQVWWLNLDEVPAQDRERLNGMIDIFEQARAARFRLPGKRFAFIAAHALVRGLLSSRTGLPPEAWKFSAEPAGRPKLVNLPGLPQLQISLSHTRGLAIAAISKGRAVGIDAEWLGRRLSVEAILNAFFAPIERRQLMDAPRANRMRMAMTLWTLKEAYGKATGKGLSYALAAHGFELSPPALVQRPDVGGGGWLFRTLAPTSAHVAALAVRHVRESTPSICVSSADLTAVCSRLTCGPEFTV